MPYRPFGINIPEVEDGQVVSASVMNTYGRYLAALLSESKAPYSAQKTKNNTTRKATTYGTVETHYLIHSKNTMFYWVCLRVSAGTGYCRFVDHDTGYVYLELSTTVLTGWDLRWGTVSGAFSAKNNGDIVTIDVQTKATTANATITIKLMGVGQVGVINTWNPLPNFTDGTTSKAQDLNDLRDNLRRLENSYVPNMNPLLASEPQKALGSDSWVDVMNATIRYRPDDLIAYVEWKGGGGTGVQWRVLLYNWADPDTVVATYTKSGMGIAGDWAWSGSTIPWDTYGFTEGNWIRLRLQGYNDSGTADIRRVVFYRNSDLVTDANWAAPQHWQANSANDDDMHHSELIKLSTDTQMLYNGAEQIFPERLATLPSPSTTEGDAKDRSFTGIHRKRWLACKAHSDKETPSILYGAGLAEAIDLPYNSHKDWQIYDLDEYPELNYGTVYVVTGADVAIESTLLPVEP